MNVNQVESVHRAVEAYLLGPEGRKFDIGSPSDFDKLIAYVRLCVSNMAMDDLYVVTALCVLGPGSASDGNPVMPTRQRGIETTAIIDELSARLRSLRPQGTISNVAAPGEISHLLTEAKVINGLIRTWLERQKSRRDQDLDDAEMITLESFVAALVQAVQTMDATQLLAVAHDVLLLLERIAARLTRRAFRGAQSPPPVAMCDELQAIIRQVVPEQSQRQDRTMECAIAYGCGKWRQVQSGMDAWNTRWSGALRALARAMIPAVREADQWMRAYIVGFPDRSDEQLWHEATRLAWRISRPEHVQKVLPGTIYISSDASGLSAAKVAWTTIRGEATLTVPSKPSLVLPQGTTIIFGDFATYLLIQVEAPGMPKASRELPHGATAEITVSEVMELAIWECGCGHKYCAQRHRLAAWDPTTMVQRTTTITTADGKRKNVKEPTPLTLWNFAASAVKGPLHPIKPGSFQQGMYFPLLTEEME